MQSISNEVARQPISLKAMQGRGVYETTGTRETIRERDSYTAVSQTAYYDDGCTIHISDKFGSGYQLFRTTRSVCRTIGQLSQTVRFEGGHPSPDDSSTDEESEQESEPEEGQVVRYSAGYPVQQEQSEEELSDKEPETAELAMFARQASSTDLILLLLTLIQDSKGLLLLQNAKGIEQMVNESELQELFTKMRKELQNTLYKKNSIDYERIV